MDTFGYVAAILMIILGLGITELLKDLVTAFRDRDKTQLHWIPLMWAAIVFAHQIQFLWAIFELETLIHSWTAVKFMVMLFLGLHLFVAGALVVPRTGPDHANIWEAFHQNGRWALAILSSYFLIAFIINPPFFGIPLWGMDNMLNLVLCLYLVLMLFVRRKIIWAWGSLLYVVMATSEIVLLSPVAYN